MWTTQTRGTLIDIVSSPHAHLSVGAFSFSTLLPVGGFFRVVCYVKLSMRVGSGRAVGSYEWARAAASR